MKKKFIGIVSCLFLILTIFPVSGDQILGDLSGPSPADGSTMVTIYADLSWNYTQQEGNEGYTYDVYFGTVNPPPKVAGNITNTTYDPGILIFETTYYWQIVIWEMNRDFFEGPIWQFTTAPNQPPMLPQILDGPTVAGPMIALNFSAIAADPDLDDVLYQWDWGDGTISNWFGPYGFGMYSKATYRWKTTGEFDITVRAKDSLGQESSWSNAWHISINQQIRIGTLEPGYLYFNFLGYDESYGFVNALKKVGWSLYISTGDLSINATVTSAVQTVIFDVKNYFFPAEHYTITDADMTDGCEEYLPLRQGFYKAIAYAYDQDGTLIDSHSRDYFMFFKLGKSRGN